MDKTTAKTLREIDQLTADLKKCERLWKHIRNVRVSIYINMPLELELLFGRLCNALEELKKDLQG